MNVLILNRYKDDGSCTTGEIILGNTTLYTLEEPWKDNEQGHSCVPLDSYIVKPHGWEPDTTLHQKQCYELQNVPGRTGILIHSGNTVDDIEGCILVGLDKGVLNGKTAVLRSREAMDVLRGFMAQKPFTLVVQNG